MISRAQLDIRKAVDAKAFEASFPLAPAFNLFAPALLATAADLQLPADAERSERRGLAAALELLQDHRGYNFQVRNKRQKSVLIAEERIEPHPLLRMRAMELELATECMNSLSASDLSVTIRLPNDVNRTSGAGSALL